ncbi:MAG: PilZ domain-containing protein [Elusimicrobia bacterium]|nr:PilZ domain-containing protein [Elusimicrobiota bacterium]
MFGSSSSPSSFHNPIRLRRAFGEEKQAKRVFERFPCDLPVTVWAQDGKTRAAEGRLRNLSMGGGLVECGSNLQRAALYFFRIGQGAAAATLSGRVARVIREGSVRSNQYGITFTLGAKQQGWIKATIDQLRTRNAKAPIADNKIKWYWGV